MSGKIMGLAVRSLATALCLCVGLSPGLGRTGAAVRRRRRPRALRRGPRRPVAPGVADQDHDRLPDVRGDQGGQADARVQDRLLGAREPAGPHQGRPACRRKPSRSRRALQALIIKSANDVAVMLAEAVAGSHEAFVEHMNATAARLGMTRTRFANANGLPAPEQITTARDLAKLSSAVVRDYPQVRAHVVDGRDPRRQAPPAHPQRAAHQLRRRRRPQDRLHLRQRLQRGRQRHARRPQADRGGAGREHRRGAQRARRQPARARLPDLRLEGPVRAPVARHAAVWPRTSRAP